MNDKSDKIEHFRETCNQRTSSEDNVTLWRQGWEQQFHLMAQHGDDKLLDAEPLVLTDWENAEWVW